MLVRQKSYFARERAGFDSGIPLLQALQAHRTALFRFAVVFATLVLAPIFGVLIAKLEPVLILVVAAAPLALIGLQWSAPRPEFAPLIILATAIFVTVSLPTGTESRIVISLLLTVLFVGIWVIRMALVEKRFHLKPSPLNKPLLGFSVIVALSLSWSMIFRDPLIVIGKSVPLVQTASAVVMIMLPAAFLLVANHISDVKLLKAMVAIMLIAGVIAILWRYGQDRAIIHDGGLFSMWVVSLSTGLAFFGREMSWKGRGLLIALAGSWIVWGFGLHISWVAGWLPAFVALGVLLFMRSKKLLMVGLGALLIIVSFKANYYLGTVVNNENSESGTTRMAAWEVNWRVTGKHLFLGTGPGGYATYYMSYFPQDAMATHNNYVDIIAQTGIFGFGAMLWFFFGLAWLGYKLCQRLRGRGDFVEGLANAALAGTVGCIVAMAFGDWLFPFAYTQTITGYDYEVYSWLFMGTILVLDRLYPKSEPVGETAAQSEIESQAVEGRS
jgi:O-antigen ligase